MTTALLTPYARGRAVELGSDSNGRKLYRKQLLKFGPITVDGRHIDFDADYARDVIRSFRDRIVDAVPFQLTDAKNTHTNDPERTRGLIRGLELSPTEDGLDMLVDMSADGARVVDEYPELAVSARIFEDVAYADGRSGRRVLQHVLGTWDPHLGGMRPWAAVALAASDDKTTVIDLTAATYDNEENSMATFTDEEIAKLRALLNASSDGNAGDDVDKGEKQDDAPADDAQLLEMTDEEVAAELEKLDIGDLDELLASLGDGPDDDADEDGADDEDDDASDKQGAASDQDGELVGAAALSNTQLALELSHAQGNANAVELAAVRDELDESTYGSERDAIARDAGIPPRIVELAKPLLKGRGHSVELANGDTVDAGQIVRQVFTEVGKLVKALDLSAELGHAVDLAASEEQEQEAKDREKFVAAARSQYDL